MHACKQVAFSSGNNELRDSSRGSAQHTSTTGHAIQFGGKPPLHSPHRGLLLDEMPVAACEQQPDHPALASAGEACMEAYSRIDNRDRAGHAVMGTTSKEVRSSNASASTIKEAGRESADRQSQAAPSRNEWHGSGAHGAAGGPTGATEPAATQQTPEGKTGEGMQQGRSAVRPGTNFSRRGAAAAAVQPEEDLKPGPVFVPIVLCMDDADHELLVREWHACHSVRACLMQCCLHTCTRFI